MNKDYRKSFRDLWRTYDTTKIIIVGIVLGLTLTLLDYYDIPLAVLYSVPLPVMLVILGGVGAVITVWLFANHYFDLFRIVATNPLDVVALVVVLASVSYISACWLILGYSIYTEIAFWLSVALVLLLTKRIIVRGRKYEETFSKNSNLVDLKDLYDNKVSRDPEMPILIHENDVDYDLFDRSELINAIFRI